MIPLQLRARVEGRREPFVVRLAAREKQLGNAGSGVPFNPHDAQPLSEEQSGMSFALSDGKLELFGAPAAELTGDVLLVIPQREVAHRLIRARSRHNTFLVTEQCDQLCVMCSQPPKKTHSDLYAHFSTAAELAPPNVSIGISGGEPTLYKQELFAFLERAHTARPDLSFHVLTNAQHFNRDDRSLLRSSVDWRTCWGIPLYAPSSTEHDLIVGKPGAFQRLLSSLSVLMRAGAVVELRTVLMTSNAQLLPRLARFVAHHLSFVSVWAVMQLENIGYARDRWEELFYDHSKDFAPLAESIDIVRARGVAVSLYNFPRCTVPLPYRSLAVRSISDWKQRYLPVCVGCAEREACAGFFEWYPEKMGFWGVRPL